MSDLSVTNLFSDGDIVLADSFNTNYTSDIVAYINARNSASSTWDAFYMTSTTNVATFNNSTGTQDVAQIKDNGTNVFTVNDGGFVNAPYQDYAYVKLGISSTLTPGETEKVTGSVSIQSQTHSSMDTTPKFTCVQNGKYLVIFSHGMQATAFGTGATDKLTVKIYKNGASVSELTHLIDSPASSPYHGVFLSDVLNLNSGDYLEPYVTNESATNTYIWQSSAPARWFVMKL